jgi:hypothetical protein
MGQVSMTILVVAGSGLSGNQHLVHTLVYAEVEITLGSIPKSLRDCMSHTGLAP